MIAVDEADELDGMPSRHDVGLLFGSLDSFLAGRARLNRRFGADNRFSLIEKRPVYSEGTFFGIGRD